MRNLIISLYIGILSMMALSVSAQDVITLVNIDYELGFPTRIYSFSEIDSLVSTTVIDDESGEEIPTIADSIDVVLLLYTLEQYGLADACEGFWYQSVLRYLEAPEKAAEANEAGDYYHPQCAIYVPYSNIIGAIIFDWSEDYVVAITTADENGYYLWVLYYPESLDYPGSPWGIFRDTFYQFIIDHNW